MRQPFNHHYIFKFIRSNFDVHNASLLNEWRKTNIKIVKTTLKLYFLKTCKKHDIIPAYILRSVDGRFKFTSNSYKNKYNVAKLRFLGYVINIQIRDAYGLLQFLNRHASQSAISLN